MERQDHQKPPISYDAPPSDSDTEYDPSRLSSDSAPFDHEWLQGEQEQQELLTRNRAHSHGILDRVKRRPGVTNAQEPQLQRGERGLQRATERRNCKRELIHKIEEGGSRGGTPFSDSSDNSSELDREKMGATLARRKTSKTRRICGYTLLHLVIAGLFVLIAYGAYLASKSTRARTNEKPMLSNGTSLFAPTTIFISLDGFRADYLQRSLSPTLAAFVKQGVSPKFMTPSFPSLTFPNHYTLVTGLYPESHGIVANSFYDETFDEEFYYTQREHSMQPKWWDQNPIWETAERQDVPTAIHMWPGSEAHIGDNEPRYVDKYNGSEVLFRKVERILTWLDIPGPLDPSAKAATPRPQLIAAYVPNVDAQGHKYGPNSTQVNATIVQVDDMLQTLFSGLDERNLTDIVNIVIVSDHGMATTSYERLVQLEDIVDTSLIEHYDGWPHYGLRPKNNDDLTRIHQRLTQEASQRDGFDVYPRERMPERWHFQHNDRIAPLWIVAHTGWAIVPKDEYDVLAGQASHTNYDPAGIHGYDNEDPLMRSIFVARGPAFPHQPGSRLEPFQNIEVYNIVCDSIGIVPHANNGTLRLPLKPVGIHGDVADAEPEHITEHEVPAATTTSTGTKTTSEASPAAEVKGHELDTEAQPHDGMGTIEDNDSKNRPTPKEMAEQYWKWVKGNFSDFVQWTKDKLHTDSRPP